ncbi:MAG TPA: ABC transporter permease, partial [Candidatus Obscuribacterales bacterium]
AGSRGLISRLMESKLFRDDHMVSDEQQLNKQIGRGQLAVGVVIPSNFEQQLEERHQAKVRIILDGVDAYTAGIANVQLKQVISEFEPLEKNEHKAVVPSISILYNPDLRSSWYFIPGVLGAMLTLTSTLVSSSVLLREKELGTLEQLLLTPYETWEILLGKIAPIFALLMCDAGVAVLTGMLVFGVPFRGDVGLFALASALYVFVGIGLGMMLATVCRTERQSHLVSFFVNVPVMQLSGAVVPFETMPKLLQDIGTLDPLRYFTVIARSLMIKGAGFGALWPDLLALFMFALALFCFSLKQFRRQLS